MSDGLAIRCESVSKAYVMGSELSLQQTLRHLTGRETTIRRFHALDDVSFTVPQGEFFGIVGSNGSGKSTLTQLISGIALPTAGAIDVWGRVLPLLEVGAGFHEELSGRENVTLLATIFGLQPPEIDAAMPQISDFSGVHEHLDTPLKRYSSGMRARLSFATAICFPADVYVFDEVLAVVDDEFRDRCVTKMHELHAEGRTILLMSHDLKLIRTACRTGMWLDRGKVRIVGDIDEVADAYQTASAWTDQQAAAG
jgi:ABC-type polysaccharide/polyol phosphate transport system ATPase subunit